jgi:hypothetical protein
MFTLPKWKDVMVFRFAGASYLLQGKKYKNGKTVFRVAHMKNFAGCVQPSDCTQVMLEKANLWRVD